MTISWNKDNWPQKASKFEKGGNADKNRFLNQRWRNI